MSKTAKYTIILMVTTVLAKVLGFVRELSLAYVYGGGIASDVYFIAFSIPTILFAGFGTALLTCYIPIYTDLQEHRPQQTKRFNNSVMTLVLIISVLVLAVFWLFDEPIVRMFAIGFEGDAFNRTVALANTMMISVLFIGVTNIIQGFLQIKGGFLVVGIVSLPLNIFVIASILLSAGENDKVLALGPVLGSAATLIMLFIAAARRGFTYRPQLDLADSNIHKVLRLVIPIFFGRTVMQINNMVDRTLASTLPEGSVSALSYASRIYGFVMSVFVISLTTAIFPRLAKQNTRHSTESFKQTAMTSVRLTTLIVLPISAGAIVLAQPVVQLLFGRGAFTAQNVEMTAQALVYYSIGLVFYSLKEILSNVFYSMQDTRTPTVNSILSVLLNIVFSLLLIKPMGFTGLALGTAIASAVTTVTIMIQLRKKIGPLGLKQYVISLVKMVFATLVMGFSALKVYELLSEKITSTAVPLGGAVVVGAVLYFGILIVLRTKEMGELIVGAVSMLQGRRKHR